MPSKTTNTPKTALISTTQQHSTNHTHHNPTSNHTHQKTLKYYEGWIVPGIGSAKSSFSMCIAHNNIPTEHSTNQTKELSITINSPTDDTASNINRLR